MPRDTKVFTEHSATALVRRGPYGAALNTAALREAMAQWGPSLKFDFFVTLNFNRPTTMQAGRDDVKAWHARMDRDLVGPNWAADVDRTFFIGFVENPDSNTHIHFAVRFPRKARNLSLDDLKRIAASHWKRLVPSGQVDIREIREDEPFFRYITKQLSNPRQYENFLISHGI